MQRQKLKKRIRGISLQVHEEDYILFVLLHVSGDAHLRMMKIEDKMLNTITLFRTFAFTYVKGIVGANGPQREIVGLA